MNFSKEVHLHKFDNEHEPLIKNVSACFIFKLK